MALSQLSMLTHGDIQGLTQELMEEKQPSSNL